MRTFALHRVDGGVEIMHTNIDPAACIAKYSPERQAELVGTFVEIDTAAIPSDRMFRNAWRANGSGIYCDMTAANGLARDMLRRERGERFKVLDGQWMRAHAKGDLLTETAVEDKREILRNWPQDSRIDGCASADDLKALVQTMKNEV
jgi:hypothetical protein